MLDGMLLSLLAGELREKLNDSRIEKIYQVSKEELVFVMKSRTFSGRLFISAKGSSPRLHITDFPTENPQNPPMFCMLLRKRLIGARLINIRQNGFERVIFLDFDAVNELGDRITLTLAVEIMARCSNIILVDGEGRIIDSVRRVNADLSSRRLILPGIRYEEVPPQNKVELTAANVEQLTDHIINGKERPLSKAILSETSGISPIIARELSFKVAADDKLTADLTSDDVERLKKILLQFVSDFRENAKPYLILQSGKPIDFTFIPIEQYGGSAISQQTESFSSLPDAFYSRKAEQERMHQKGGEIFRLITQKIERATRKIALQKEELADCKNRDSFRICGELINANLYRIKRGDSFCECENYYNNNEIIRIPLDVQKTPSQNSQKYFKDYRKSVNAEKMLTEQIEKGEEEISYLESVFDALSRISTESELNEIRRELEQSGYIRIRRGGKKQMKTPALLPRRFITANGFEVLVGRNNLQNDSLTFKLSDKNDLWFHTKDIHGSHTVLRLNGKEPQEEDIVTAAKLAAYHSRAQESANVPVDYTLIRYVKKPAGAKAGKVIYVNNKTLYVTPDRELAERSSVK